MIEPYEFQEIQGGDGTTDFQVGFPLQKQIKNDAVKDAFIPFGLVISPNTMKGGNPSFSSTIRKKAVNEDCHVLPEAVFTQLFSNVMKPGTRLSKNKTIRKR